MSDDNGLSLSKKDEILLVYPLIMHRKEAMQDRRFEWIKFSMISTFAYFAWLISNINEISSQSVRISLAALPLIFNLLGLFSGLSFQRSVKDRKNLLVHIETKYFPLHVGWEEHWENLKKTRKDEGKVSSVIRTAIASYWLLVLLICSAFLVIVAIGVI